MSLLFACGLGCRISHAARLSRKFRHGADKRLHGCRLCGGTCRRRTRRSADRRSSLCATARSSGGRQRDAGVERRDGARGNSGHPTRGTGCRRRAADRGRSLCDARTLHDVRGGHFLCPHPPALLCSAGHKRRAVESGVRFYAQPTCHHAPEVYSGIRETEAAEMLKGFFQTKRET